jgi:hypothetical protein
MCRAKRTAARVVDPHSHYLRLPYPPLANDFAISFTRQPAKPEKELLDSFAA